MDWLQIVQFGQSVMVGVVGVVAWIVGRQRRVERSLLNARFKRLEERHKELGDEFEERVEHINKQLSTKFMPCLQALSARVDRMPDELRAKFLPLDLANALIEESRRDRAALWDEVKTRGGRGHPR